MELDDALKLGAGGDDMEPNWGMVSKERTGRYELWMLWMQSIANSNRPSPGAPATTIARSSLPMLSSIVDSPSMSVNAISAKDHKIHASVYSRLQQ